MLRISNPTYADVAKMWRNHMDAGENRDSIYGRAVDKCNLVCRLYMRCSLVRLLFH
jgi:hypothetical protein